MNKPPYNVLFLCTGNSARSIMAEGLLNVLGNGRFRAYSAGSQPGGVVNPFAVEQLSNIGYASNDLRSKSWNEFAIDGAPRMDFIITVCDNAAGEICPIWPGQPASAHWGFPDPAALKETDEKKRALFHDVFVQIQTRIRSLVSLPDAKLEKNAIRATLKSIHAEGSAT